MERSREDEQLITSSLYPLLWLILGKRNEENITRFKEIFDALVEEINIVPIGQEGQFIGRDRRKGVCYLMTSGKVRMEIFGLQDANPSQYEDILYSSTHEFTHAVVEIFSRIRGKYPTGVVRDGVKTSNAFGAVKKEGPAGEQEYGIMFNETMMDMIAAMAMNSYIVDGHKSVNEMLVTRQNEWGNDGSAYSFLTSVTRLMIASFSTNPNIDYDRLIEEGRGIFDVRTTLHDGSSSFANDFLYGIVFDPMHIEEVYDGVMGEGKYQELCEKVDNLFARVDNNRELSAGEVSEDISNTIKYLMETLPDFLNQRMAQFRASGKLTDAEISAINSNFNRIWNSMQREYRVLFTRTEVSSMIEEQSRYYTRGNNEHQNDDGSHNRRN